MKRILLALLLGLPFATATPSCQSTETSEVTAAVIFAVAGQLELASQDPQFDAETRVGLAEAADALQVVGHAIRAGATVEDLHSAIDAFLAVAQQVRPLLEEKDQATLGYILHGMRLVNDILRGAPTT